jgi:ABC-2 type transport system permease protein
MNTARQTVAVFRKYLRLTLSNPYVVMAGIAQPLLYLYLFGPLLTSIAPLNSSSGVTSYDVFVPGILIQLVLFGAAFVGLSTITEWRSGELERVLATPASRFALLAGRILRDVVALVIEGIFLIAAAYTLGLRQPLSSLLLVLLIIAILTVAIASMSYLFALITKSEEALSGILNGILLPLTLLGGLLLPMSLAPKWLFTTSRFNPLSYIVDASRSTFTNDIGSWKVSLGLGVSAALAVVLFAMAHAKLSADQQ